MQDKVHYVNFPHILGPDYRRLELIISRGVLSGGWTFYCPQMPLSVARGQDLAAPLAPPCRDKRHERLCPTRWGLEASGALGKRKNENRGIGVPAPRLKVMCMGYFNLLPYFF